MTKQIDGSATRHFLILTLILLAAAWVATAAPPIKITDEVATPADLTAELRTLLTTVEQALATPESYNERRDQLKRAAMQMAIFADVLAKHETDSPLKRSATSLRNSAQALIVAMSYDEATPVLARLKESMEGKVSDTPAAQAGWGKVARGGVMGAMKERSESIRRALRRPKDPDAESRHAMAIALMALSLHVNSQALKDLADRPVWEENCIELQQHMSRTAAAIKSKDGTAADHFRLGMEACDKCHLKFKP